MYEHVAVDKDYNNDKFYKSSQVKLFLTTLYLNFRYAFLLTSPAVAVYLFSYFVIIKAPNHPVNTEPQSQIQADPEKERLLRDDYINGDTGEVQGKTIMKTCPCNI